MATTPPVSQASPTNSGGQPPQQGAQPPQQLSQEQIQQMQLVVKQCMQMLLQDQAADMIVAKAKQGDPAQVLASIVAPLLSRIHESASAAGANVGMVTMMVAGVQVLSLLAEMLFQADVIPSEQEAAQVVAQASKIAVEQHNAQVQGQGGAPAQGQPPQPPAGGGMMMQGV